MALIPNVVPGKQFVEGELVNTDALNLLGRPSITLTGTVGGSEIGGYSIDESHIKPGHYFYASASGAGGAYAVTLGGSISAYSDGLWLSFTANHTNPGGATLNVNGLGSKALGDVNGESLTGGEIQAGAKYWVQYDATAFRLISAPSKAPILYAVDTGSANTYVASVPALDVASLTSIRGLIITFKATAANTGASTLNLNTLGATAIKKKGTTDLSSGDILAGQMVSVTYDGTAWQLVGSMDAPALPAVGAAGALTYPYSMTVDAEGRVTAKAGGVYSASVAVPAKGAAATFTHGLGRTPAFVRVVAVMGSTTEHGFTAGDELEIGCIYADTGGSDFDGPAFNVTANGSTVVVGRAQSAGNEMISTKSGNAVEQTWTAANWTVKVYGW